MGQVISDVKDILNYQDSKKENAAARKEILKQIASDENTKQNLVNKVLATQRAKYGAAGMKSGGQTEEAVLARLKDETEKPYDEKKQTNLKKLKNTRSKKKNLLLSALEHMDKLAK